MADNLEPWEQPEGVRRDCEPHRAALLALVVWVGLPLCLVSTLFNGLSAMALASGLGGFGATEVYLAAVPAAFATWGLAGGLWWACHRDLALMRDGRMDPDGRAATARVRFHAIVLAAFRFSGCSQGLSWCWW
jgi:hypothetical protein